MKHVKKYGWVLFGGMVLAFNAGFINTTVLLSFVEHGVSHMTGNIALIGANGYTGNFNEVLSILGIVCSFLIGSIINAIMLDSQSFSLNHEYGRSLILQATIMYFGVILLNHNLSLWSLISGECLIAMACGMQNGMTTIYSGAVIRTTHMTGAVTDLGTEIGRFLKGASYEAWKIKTLLCLIISFMGGSTLGAALEQFTPNHPFDSLWGSVLIIFFTGLCFSLWSYRRKEKSKTID